MYKDNFVVAVKVDGKVLREKKDIVALPFGSEYSVYLKNFENRRALVNVFVDGDNVAPGGLVVSGGCNLDIERFIRNGNLDAGNKFKFIERTDAVEAGRGVKAEDGLIRVEVKFEQFYRPTFCGSLEAWPSSGYNWPNHIYHSGSCTSSPLLRSTWVRSGTGASIHAQALDMTEQSQQNAQQTSGANEAGITVPGGHSGQKFQLVSGFQTESETHTIVLRLVGRSGKYKIEEAKTVEAKPTCITCRKVNKATSNYCSRCGTSLQII